MLLMPLMRSTPPFWMPQRRRQTLVTEDLCREDRDPSLRSRWQPLDDPPRLR